MKKHIKLVFDCGQLGQTNAVETIDLSGKAASEVANKVARIQATAQGAIDKEAGRGVAGGATVVLKFEKEIRVDGKRVLGKPSKGEIFAESIDWLPDGNNTRKPIQENEDESD